MWKIILLVVLPVAIILGGLAWYIGGDGTFPWQTAQVNQPGTVTAPGTKAKGPGWAVNCKSDVDDQALDCRVSQTVVMQGSGRVLTQVTFLFPAAPQQPELNIQLPLGTAISTGATVRVDNEAPQKFAFRTCDRSGCYAQGAVSPQLLASLRKGGSLTVEFQDLSDKTIKLPLSLDGFDEAYGKVQKA